MYLAEAVRESSLEEVAFQVGLESGTVLESLEKSIVTFKGWQVDEH